MATVRTNQAPNPAVFGSDPIEQIHAKQLYDPANSGYALAFMQAARGERGANVAQYLQGLSEANKQNVQMQQVETQQKGDEALGKLSLGLIDKAGVDLGTLPALARALGGPAQQAATSASVGMLPAEAMRAKIAAARASAAGGGPKPDKEKLTVTIPGSNAQVTLDGHNLNDASLQRIKALADAMRKQGLVDRNAAASTALEDQRR